MTSSTVTAASTDNLKSIHKKIAAYARPNTKKAIVQLLNSFLPYVFLWGVLIYMHRIGLSFWLTIPVIMVATVFLTRMFIIFHDCTHGSFLKSNFAMRMIGYVFGILTFTAFDSWRSSHWTHHNTAGNLDNRGIGDVPIMTVKEYKNASLWNKLVYRVVRNPFFMLVFGPIVMFFIIQRYPRLKMKKNEHVSVFITNTALVLIMVAAHYTIGLGTYLMIQLPIMYLAGVLGLWLFYVQHQYENVYWVRRDEWSMLDAGFKGSSNLKLPKFFHWCTGNIGFHHIHHVNPGIPNYNLLKCYTSTPELQEINRLTFPEGIKSLGLSLWDEDGKRLVSFRAARKVAA